MKEFFLCGLKPNESMQHYLLSYYPDYVSKAGGLVRKVSDKKT
jgi:hypothetical protein